MSQRVRVLLVLSVMGLGALGCFKFSSSAQIPDAGAPGVVSGPGVGSACVADRECRPGLTCHAELRSCQPAGNSIENAMCVLSAECLPGHYCSILGKCTKSGMAAEGGQCSTEGDCQSGLTCLLSGLYGTCVKPGASDFGQACNTTADCRAGLICSLNQCKTFFSVTPWPGAMGCPVEEEATGKVHFQVPRATDLASEDYFRLPFPNDIRKKGGKIDFTGFPRPGARLLPVDAVDVYVKAIQEDGLGFGLNPVVYFRFSRDPALGPGAGIHSPEAVSFYDITPGTPEYGFKTGHHWSASTGGSAYICPRALMVQPPIGSPLRPGRTYAVVLTKAITDKDLNPMRRDTDFGVMLEAAAPADPELAAAWTAYTPLRAWIADKQVKADDIVAAAVFTTDKVDEPVGKLREAVRAVAPAPAIAGLVRCGSGAASPCDDGMKRGCREPHPGFDEYQGKVTIPGFQQGKVPFELPSDGGGIQYAPSGLPVVARTEEVCVSLTVPKGTPPAAGWPIVVYGHGTGGDYRSHVLTELAADFAAGDVGEGAPVPMAMLGYDGTLHGPRKGTSMRPTDELVFNYLNPRAARDTSLQAAADLFAIARALEGFAADGIKIDPAKIALYGHSQGGNAGALAAAYEPLYGAVVLSGTGGGLVNALLGKKKPVSVAAALPVIFSDTLVGSTHPVLGLMQLYFDRADPLNFARRISVEPPMGSVPHHLLHVYGSDDTYSPDVTQEHFGNAAALPVVHPVVTGEALQRIVVLPAPQKENMMVADKKITAVQAQYAPAPSKDGHFVSTENPAARRALRRMLGTYFRDGVPVAE